MIIQGAVSPLPLSTLQCRCLLVLSIFRPPRLLSHSVVSARFPYGTYMTVEMYSAFPQVM